MKVLLAGAVRVSRANEGKPGYPASGNTGAPSDYGRVMGTGGFEVSP